MNDNLLILFKKIENNYDVVKNLLDNDIITLEQGVEGALEAKNGFIITKLFYYIKREGINNREIDKKLVDAIMEINNPKHICEFIKYLIKYDRFFDLDLIDKLKNKVLKINKLKYINRCFELLCNSQDYIDIFYNEINQLAVLLINTKNIDYLKNVGYCFCGTDEMVNEALLTNDLDYICKFVYYVSMEDELLDKIINWVIKNNDSDNILKFCSKTLVNRSKIEEVIANTKDIDNILKFISHTKCEDESKLSEIVIKHGTKEQILKLKESLKNKENEKYKKEEKNNNSDKKTDLEKIERLIELTSEVNYDKIEELEKNKDIFIELLKEPSKTKKLTK